MAMNPEELRAIVQAAVEAASANNAANNRAIVEAAVNAATSNQTSSQQSMRRPTLPVFDPLNIDNWIRRVESAFSRLNITDAKIKFANIDEKIDVNSDPNINRFMNGPSTSATWNELIKYLKKKHGRTTKQMAASVIEGSERDGRTPSQMWSLMLDKAGTVTLDDVLKEQMMRRLPKEVRGHLQDKIKGKTGQEVADLADAYFDTEGNLLEKSSASGINAVRPSSMKPSTSRSTSRTTRSPNRPPNQPSEATAFTTAFDEDDESADVNAVRFKDGKKQNFRVQNGGRSQSRGRSFSGNSGSNTDTSRYPSSSNSSRSNNFGNRENPTTKTKGKVCYYHVTYGDKAEKCEEHCMMWSKHQAGKGRASR